MEDLWFNEVITKIETYEGMYYTVGKHTKEEILDRKKDLEKRGAKKITYSEITDSFIRDDLDSVIGSNHINAVTGNKWCDDSGLIYLDHEHKIINKKEIKESLIQFI